MVNMADGRVSFGVTMTPEEGRRLRAFVERHSVTETGWVNDLAVRVGVTKSSLMAWFSGTNELTMPNLKSLAAALGCRRWEIVAAIDGDGPR